MNFLLVGGRSALAGCLKKRLLDLGNVLTCGRADCDLDIDLNWDKNLIKIPANIDVVINLAASFGGNSAEEVLEAIETNCKGPVKILDAVKKSSVKHFIHISSTSALLNESSPYYGAYSISKKHGDELIQHFCRSCDIKYTILQPSQLYGNSIKYKRHQPFLYTSIESALSAKNIVIYGSKNARRNYIHADDFSKVISLTIKKQVFGVYQVTHPQDTSFEEIGNIIINYTKTKGISIEFDTSKPDIKDNIFKYNQSIYKKTNFFPEVTIGMGIHSLIKFLSKE
jgi:nucleoside-diphosphate-sugar epimerase